MNSAMADTTPGTVVQIANRSGNPAQEFSRRGDKLYSELAGLCATAVNGGAGIQLQACDKSKAQIFQWG